MSKDIKFSPEYGKNTASKIGKHKSTIDGEVRRLNNLICNDLCSKWEGQASTKYKAEFTTLKADVMDKFITMLGDLEKQLKEISNAMEDADRQISSKIKMK